MLMTILSTYIVQLLLLNFKGKFGRAGMTHRYGRIAQEPSLRIEGSMGKSETIKRTVTDITTLRVMSNPERMRILGLLRNRGAHTVGQISSEIGLAPGSVSYHLKRLAAVGLAEQMTNPDMDRRQSWWQASDAAIEPAVSPDEGASKEVRLELGRASVRTYFEAYERYLQGYRDLPRAWREHEIRLDTVLSLTPEEMGQFESDLEALLDAWTKRVAATTGHASSNHDHRSQVLIALLGFPWQP
ncbi:DNA-binding transcriptional ArsR family regulator [Olsenella profusa DSM 13989]|uniref:helix-turn-helix domain-containing protein n=2 Tax=Olsenella profusa TaxID=138595 RepID=UPI0027885CF2|nr:helix-turn-helix domain-containing protein [Olsenella profusa]MDP9858547.1 DNA-binding transcriptional ArsR family regulator [Olsenella profusa DSM 13989]